MCLRLGSLSRIRLSQNLLCEYFGDKETEDLKKDTMQL